MDALEYALDTYPDSEHVVLYVVDRVEAIRGEAHLPEPLEQPWVEATAWWEAFDAHVETVLDEARSIASDRDHELEVVVEAGRVSNTIVEYADREGIDAVVMGHHGRPFPERLFIGSTALDVTRRASVPVTTVR